MNTKIAILLGAGSSQAAGFSSTQELTDLVLSGEGVWRHTNESYVADGTNPADEKTRLATSMARRLCAKSERYYLTRAGRRPNYEDLYYLARQAYDEETGNLENPAVLSFAQRLTSDTSQLITEVGTTWPETLFETCNYIADVVWKNLSDDPKSESQLSIIEHVCKSANVTVTSISTLCHDTHVETFLNRRGVALVDGFSEAQDAPSHWNGDCSSVDKTQFLKLHGSVNWFRYTDGTTRCIPPHCDPHIKIGVDWQYPDSRPLLLIGTFNKISDYSSGIFRELHYRFRSTIRDARRLVICGYSFGDKGINGEIVDWVRGVDWVHEKEERRLVIIHPDPMDLVANARGAIQQIFDDWETNPLIKIVEQRFEDVSFTELEKAISL